MTEGECALVRISAAMATRRKDALRNAFEKARGVAPDEAIEEVILQGYLFLGFPAALNAMSADMLRELADAVATLERDDTVSAVIITGPI